MKMEYLKLSKVLFKKPSLKEKKGDVFKIFNLMTPFWNGIDTVQYKVILGDCEQLANIVPKKKYSLVIVDIPHAYNIQNIG
jgi:hypothetical protein